MLNDILSRYFMLIRKGSLQTQKIRYRLRMFTEHVSCTTSGCERKIAQSRADIECQDAGKGEETGNIGHSCNRRKLQYLSKKNFARKHTFH